jgi:hypothetical protein
MLRTKNKFWERATEVQPPRIRGIRGSDFTRKEVNELQFQVEGRQYFLAFVEQERRWYVFTPTASGVHRIPVYVDATSYDRAGILSNETHLAS